MVDEKKITSAEEAQKKRAQNRDPHQPSPEAGINVGFSPKGMKTVRSYFLPSIDIPSRIALISSDILMLAFLFVF